MIKILLIGPLPPPVGGDTRHFATLERDLRASDFEITLVDTARGLGHASPIRNFAVATKTIAAVLGSLREVDLISFHASDRGILLLGPIIVSLGKLARKPVVVRVFGGSFGDYYEGMSALLRALVRRLILSADVVLLQTHRMIDQLAAHATGRLEWFSTYVERSPDLAAQRAAAASASEARDCRRFVFLGHLWRTKGIDTLLDAAPDLPVGSSIDIFGPLDDYSLDEIRERGGERVRYLGLLSREEVDARLWEYHCLVLPTYHPGEGYPGVIAEAFTHDLPVITTRWLAIPEIVDESCGILVEPRDTRAFVAAIRRLCEQPDLWLRLRRGASTRGRQFDHAVWSGKFERICDQLVGRT